MTIGILAAGAAAAAVVAVNATDASGGASVQSRAQIEQIVRDYILEHPELLPQAMERLQAKRVAEVIENQRSQLETPYGSAWEGAKDADVVVVEFFDYSCGYCRASQPDIAKLITGDGKIKVVYRELPILSEQSNAAAKVSLLAAERGKFKPFHQALYAAGQVTMDSIFAAATKAGIGRRETEAAMSSTGYDAEIEKNLKLAQALGANGTPTFVIGDRMFSGAVGYEVLEDAVATARVTK